MKTINRQELKRLLENVKGATPLTISALTNTNARKKDNPFGEILKLTRVNGFTGFDYESAVNRQRIREGNPPTFESLGRAWGEKAGPALAEKYEEKTKSFKYYLRLKVQAKKEPTFLFRERGFLKMVDKSRVEKFLPIERKAIGQGLENDVIYRDYGLESIAAITINGQEYKIRDEVKKVVVTKLPKKKEEVFTEERHTMDPDNDEYYPKD